MIEPMASITFSQKMLIRTLLARTAFVHQRIARDALRAENPSGIVLVHDIERKSDTHLKRCCSWNRHRSVRYHLRRWC